MIETLFCLILMAVLVWALWQPLQPRPRYRDERKDAVESRNPHAREDTL